MISPEAQGETFAGSVELRFAATKQDEWSFTNNNIKKPFDGERQVYKIAGMLDLGLLKRLDFVYMDYLSGSTVGVYGLKVQILGKPRKEAKRGNFSLSLFGGFGANNSTYDTSDNDFQNWSTNVDKLSYQVEHHDLGLIMGYRWQDKFLQYANVYYFHENVRGKVTTDNAVLNQQSFRANQNGLIYSTGLTYDLGANWYLKGDFSHMTSKWNSTRGETNNALNAGIGVYW